MKILLVSIFVLSTLIGFSQQENRRFSLNLISELGYTINWSNSPRVTIPMDYQEKYKTIDTKFYIEVLYKLKKFKLGLGGGIIRKNNRYNLLKHSLYPKYYISFQHFGKKEKSGIFLETGITKGNENYSYIPILGFGSIFYLNKKEKLIVISIRPSVNFSFGESVDKIAYDGRTPYLSSQNYTLNFKSFSFNFSLMITLNNKW